MDTQRFEDEVKEAGTKAQVIGNLLDELHVSYDEITWRRSGMLAEVTSGDVSLGDIISLQGKTLNDLLEDIRSSWAVSLARTALAHKDDGGHIISLHEVIVPVHSTAQWMVEVSFDGEERLYALVGEYVEPEVSPRDWQRVYRLYQAKVDYRCDVLNCPRGWQRREMTSNGYCVHLCPAHQDERPDIIYLRKQQNRL